MPSKNKVMLMLVTRLQPNQQVSGVEDCGSTTYVLITWRLGICRCSSPCVEKSPVLTSCDRLCWLLHEKF